jgi:hypothetical protein
MYANYTWTQPVYYRFSEEELENGYYTKDWKGDPVKWAGYGAHGAFVSAMFQACKELVKKKLCDHWAAASMTVLAAHSKVLNPQPRLLTEEELAIIMEFMGEEEVNR